MHRGIVQTVGAACLTAVALTVPTGASQRPTDPERGTERATLTRYCVGCHNARLKTGGVILEAADPTNVGGNVELWEKVVRKLRAGMMPPPGAPAPTSDERRTLVSSLEGSLD